MLSIEECKKVLNIKSNQYSDEQITQIRDLVNCLAEVYINTNTIANEENSSDLHQGLNGSAS